MVNLLPWEIVPGPVVEPCPTCTLPVTTTTSTFIITDEIIQTLLIGLILGYILHEMI